MTEPINLEAMKDSQVELKSSSSESSVLNSLVKVPLEEKTVSIPGWTPD